MRKEIGDYKKRLDDEMLKCMDGGITGQRMMTIKEINQCWMELDDRERRLNGGDTADAAPLTRQRPAPGRPG